MLKYLGNRSLIVLTGAHNTGKTFGAYTVVPPSMVGRVYAHDAENSANNVITNLGLSELSLGYYMNLSDAWTQALPDNASLIDRMVKDDLPWATSQEKDSMIDYYRFVIRDIYKNLEQDKYDVYIHDTIERFESGMTAFVDANPKKTGWKKKAYGEIWTKGVYPLYEAFINMLYQRGVKVIIFTSHLRTPWVDNKPVVGAVEPKGKSILRKLSQLYLWLVNDPQNVNGEPAAVVMKERLGRMKVNLETDSWEIGRCLPPRIPTFTWANVAKYMQGDLDMTALSDREILSPAERQMIATTLNDKQMELMILQVKKDLVTQMSDTMPLLTKKGTDTNLSPRALARRLHDNGEGLPPSEIANQLKKPLPLVLQWLKS